jgi:hypothetical protein
MKSTIRISLAHMAALFYSTKAGLSTLSFLEPREDLIDMLQIMVVVEGRRDLLRGEMGPDLLIFQQELLKILSTLLSLEGETAEEIS